MTDYAAEQEEEIEALQAILMDDIQEVNAKERGPVYERPVLSNYHLSKDRVVADGSPCPVSSQDDDEEEPTDIPVRLGLTFAHTPNYPDEPPLFEVRSVQGIKDSDVKDLKEKLTKEATENLGMAMIYTLHTSAKEWLREKFGQDVTEVDDDGEDDGQPKDEIVEPHGEAVTVDSFLEWRDRFEAEQALERARLMPEAALLPSKEKRVSGRAWFESGRAAAVKASKPVVEEDDEEEDLDFEDDFDDEDLDEEDVLDHFLSRKS